MTESDWIKHTVPSLLFPIISALGATIIFTRSLNYSFLDRIISKCDPGAPLNTKYLGLETIDKSLLCPIAAFFEQGLQPLSTPYTTYFLINFAPVAIFMFAEGSRPGRSAWISAGAAAWFGLLCQLATGGVIIPLYFLSFVLHSHQTSTLPPVSKAHAEATTFAFIAGFFLPTFFLVYTKQPHVTLLWQPFPLWMYLSQKLHLFIWPPRLVFKGENVSSGRRMLQALYSMTAITSALAHFALILPVVNDWPAFRREFLPRFLYPGETVDLVYGTRNLLQWDATFTFAGATIAALWFGRNTRETMVIALWCISASTTMGPGAALGMLYVWRENQASVPSSA